MRSATLILTLLAATAQAQASASAGASLFTYDTTAPLDIQMSLVAERRGVRVYDLSYASPPGTRVSATLVTPIATGRRRPAVLFGHWGYGNRFEFLPEAELWARAGVVCLLPDYPWVRPAPWRREQAPGFTNPELDRALMVQTVVDLRRALDLLVGRSDVDGTRLAYVGHSYGAQWGAILSAVDRRFKAAVLVAGVGRTRDLYENDDPSMVAYVARTPPDQLTRYLDIVGELDAVAWVGRAAPTPLLLQFASNDRGYSVASMERYAAAASDPKRVSWYPGGHELNDPAALVERVRFLQEMAGFPELIEITRGGSPPARRP